MIRPQPTIDVAKRHQKLGYLCTHFERACMDLVNAENRAKELGLDSTVNALKAIFSLIDLEEKKAREERYKLMQEYDLPY